MHLLGMPIQCSAPATRATHPCRYSPYFTSALVIAFVILTASLATAIALVEELARCTQPESQCLRNAQRWIFENLVAGYAGAASVEAAESLALSCDAAGIEPSTNGTASLADTLDPVRVSTHVALRWDALPPSTLRRMQQAARLCTFVHARARAVGAEKHALACSSCKRSAQRRGRRAPFMTPAIPPGGCWTAASPCSSAASVASPLRTCWACTPSCTSARRTSALSRRCALALQQAVCAQECGRRRGVLNTMANPCRARPLVANPARTSFRQRHRGTTCGAVQISATPGLQSLPRTKPYGTDPLQDFSAATLGQSSYFAGAQARSQLMHEIATTCLSVDVGAAYCTL